MEHSILNIVVKFIAKFGNTFLYLYGYYGYAFYILFILMSVLHSIVDFVVFFYNIKVHFCFSKPI